MSGAYPTTNDSNSPVATSKITNVFTAARCSAPGLITRVRPARFQARSFVQHALGVFELPGLLPAQPKQQPRFAIGALRSKRALQHGGCFAKAA